MREDGAPVEHPLYPARRGTPRRVPFRKGKLHEPPALPPPGFPTGVSLVGGSAEDRLGQPWPPLLLPEASCPQEAHSRLHPLSLCGRGRRTRPSRHKGHPECSSTAPTPCRLSMRPRRQPAQCAPAGWCCRFLFRTRPPLGPPPSSYALFSCSHRPLLWLCCRSIQMTIFL